MVKLCYWCVLMFFFAIQLYCQQIVNTAKDSLNGRSFEDLQSLFFKNVESSKATVYATYYLEKAKRENDTLMMLKGYSFVSYLLKKELKYVSYADTILQVAKKGNNLKYLSLGYINKAEYYFDTRDLGKSLDNYLKAKNVGYDNSRRDFIIDHSIAVLKSRLGKDDEALVIFKDIWKKVNTKKYKENDTSNYLNVLFSLSDSYNRIKKYDSASYYNQLGIKESLFFKNKEKYYHFILNESVNNFHKGDIKKSKQGLDSVFNNISYLDIPNKIIAHYYQGEIQLALDKESQAITQFKKVDSLYDIVGNMLPDTRVSYEYLIKYYKKNNKVNERLKYIDKLMKVDSLLYKNYKYLNSKIIKEYDTPKLIKEKEIVIKNLTNENKKFSFWMWISIFIILISIILVYYYYDKQKKLQSRFDRLIATEKKIKKQSSVNTTIENSSLGISDEVVKGILDKLENFENTLGFLEPKLTLSVLSKKFKTNPNYMSKIINTYYKKSFSVYLNDLRINYVINELQNNSKLKNYTIKAIAREIGFSSSESFSKAFFNKNGIYPSYFIKKLKNDN